MKIKILVCALYMLSFSIAKSQTPQSAGLNFAQGIGLTAVVDWVMGQAFPDESPADPGYKAKKNTLSVILKASTDPLFRDELITRLFATNDPRRYIITALFQSGKFALKAYDMVNQLASKLSGWFVKKQTEPQFTKVFREDDIAQWLKEPSSEDMCPAERTMWQKLTEKFNVVQEIALSCLINYVITTITSKLLSRGTSKEGASAVSSLVSFAIGLVPQIAGSYGTAYLVNWVKNVVNDIVLVENSPNFNGIPLVQVAMNVATPAKAVPKGS